jgi:uncharacterized protein (DUF169 family)
MSNLQQVESKLIQSLSLRRRPVSVSILDDIPEGVDKFDGVVPSGCTFWRLAADGSTFYTVAGDHYNCPVGAYTHNIPLPESRAAELPQVLSIMMGVGYLKEDEIPGIGRLAGTPNVIVYAPLGDAPVPPDVVIVAGGSKSLMLLVEAATRAGVPAKTALLARPTCMAIPMAMKLGTVASTGCIGNRIYTELGDGESYVAIPGPSVALIAAELDTIISANHELEKYHLARREQLTAISR